MCLLACVVVLGGECFGLREMFAVVVGGICWFVSFGLRVCLCW